MFELTNKTVIKVVIIAAIILILLFLYVTGIASVAGYDAPFILNIHELSALFILGLLGMHAWLRRCTIKKLLQEFVAIVFNKQIRHEDNIDFLIQNTKNQSFKELCALLHYDISSLRSKLLENYVKIDNVEDTFKTIAKNNDKDMYQLFLLMLKLHVEENSLSPIYTSSCDRV